ncbi:MAG: hypothetical protein PHC69_04220, partial [Ruminiclostridium sp.]|nr:hypothetical protein [Ruminiclostridium sp.]
MAIKGINLEKEILYKIYRGNFERRVGNTPAGINSTMLLEECSSIIDFACNSKATESLLPELQNLYN